MMMTLSFCRVNGVMRVTTLVAMTMMTSCGLFLNLTLAVPVRSSSLCSWLLPTSGRLGRSRGQLLDGANFEYLRLQVGPSDSKITYSPAKSIEVDISYFAGVVKSFFGRAVPLFGSTLLGTWSVLSGNASVLDCSGSMDVLASVSPLDASGIVRAIWTAPSDPDERRDVEIQFTVVNSNGHFWQWNSCLIQPEVISLHPIAIKTDDYEQTFEDY